MPTQPRNEDAASKLPAPRKPAQGGNEGPAIGTGTPIRKHRLPPSSGQSGSKKG